MKNILTIFLIAGLLLFVHEVVIAQSNQAQVEQGAIQKENTLEITNPDSPKQIIPPAKPVKNLTSNARPFKSCYKTKITTSKQTQSGLKEKVYQVEKTSKEESNHNYLLGSFDPSVTNKMPLKDKTPQEKLIHIEELRKIAIQNGSPTHKYDQAIEELRKEKR